MQGKIQQLIKNYGKDSADRRHRDGYYSGKLNQLNDLWQQFCDLDEEVQQAALPTGSEYSYEYFHLRSCSKNIRIPFWTTCRLEAGFRRPQDEFWPTSRSQQERKLASAS